MVELAAFRAILKQRVPLAPFLSLRLGGAAEWLAEPTSVQELSGLLQTCRTAGIPLHLLGGGGNVLVHDDGVPGVVLRLTAPVFQEIRFAGPRVTAGAGAPVSAVIAEAARRGLAGLEAHVGLPGQVGGALRGHAGPRVGTVANLVRKIDVLNQQGQHLHLEGDELKMQQWMDLPGDLFIVSAEFELEPTPPEQLLKRLRRAWIQRKAKLPFSYQRSARMFRDLKSTPAEELIDQANAQSLRVGGASLSERNLNYVVAEPGTTAREVLELIDQVQAAVEERTGQTLQPALVVW